MHGHSWSIPEKRGWSYSASQHLRDFCPWWLMAEEQNTELFIELVVLEQIVTQLLTGTAEWVQCYRPAPLDEVMQLAEDHLSRVPVPGVLGLSHSVSLLPSYPLKAAHWVMFPPSLYPPLLGQSPGRCVGTAWKP